MCWLLVFYEFFSSVISKISNLVSYLIPHLLDTHTPCSQVRERDKLITNCISNEIYIRKCIFFILLNNNQKTSGMVSMKIRCPIYFVVFTSDSPPACSSAWFILITIIIVKLFKWILQSSISIYSHYFVLFVSDFLLFHLEHVCASYQHNRSGPIKNFPAWWN